MCFFLAPLVDWVFKTEKGIKDFLHSSLEQHYSTQQQANAVTTSWNLLQVIY